MKPDTISIIISGITELPLKAHSPVKICIVYNYIVKVKKCVYVVTHNLGEDDTFIRIPYGNDI